MCYRSYSAASCNRNSPARPLHIPGHGCFRDYCDAGPHAIPAGDVPRLPPGEAPRRSPWSRSSSLTELVREGDEGHDSFMNTMSIHSTRWYTATREDITKNTQK